MFIKTVSKRGAASTIENSVSAQITSLGELENDGSYFEGWYTDSEFTNRLDNSDGIISSDLMLYAKWIEPITITATAWEENTINVKLSIIENLKAQSGTIVITLYDNNDRLAAIHYIDVDDTIDYTFDDVANIDGNYTVRVLCWQNIETMIPLCKSVSTVVER